MKIKFLITLLTVSTLFIGCGSTNQPTAKKQTKQKTISTNKIIKTPAKKQIVDNTPNWILNPNKQNYICSIGSGENKKVAFITAKANISKNISIHINSKTAKSINCVSKECKKSFNKFSQQQSTNMLNNISINDEYIDSKNNRYYIRACSAKSNDKFSFDNSILPKYKTTKKSCIQQSAYPNKTLDQQKKILIQNAKFEALGELYGHLLVSSTDIKNGKITDDSIKQRAVGNVRIEGNPSFYNGTNLGEICSDITAYITKKDLEQFKPKKVKLKRFCYNNPSTPTNKVKDKANFQAYKKAISQYKPSLKNISDKQSAKLIHGFIKSNEKFDFDTGVYCFDAVATVLPYELELTKSKPKGMNIDEDIDNSNLISGLTAIFYAENDYDMKKPLYTTYINTLDLGYRKLPFNTTIKKDKVYNIKIIGLIKSETKTTTNLKMFADVYSASLFINSKKIMTHKTKSKNITLKKGFNKIKLIVKTANSYDIKVLGSIDDFYTNKI